MTLAGKLPVVRDLRGGRRPDDASALRAKAASLATEIRRILSRTPNYRLDEINLVELYETLNRLADPDVETSPLRLLTAKQLGQQLNGLSEDMVWLREKDGGLFSVLPPGRRRGRLYPAFQVLDGVIGEPIACVLQALKGLPGERQWAFFQQRRCDLERLSAVEVMLGRTVEPRDVSTQAIKLAEAEGDERLHRVLTSALLFRREAIKDCGD